MSYKFDQKLHMKQWVCLFLFVKVFWVLFCVCGFYCFVLVWFWCFVFLFFLSVKSKTLIVLLNGLELLPSYQLWLQGVLQTIQGTCGVQKGKMLAFGYSYFFIVSFCLSILIETVSKLSVLYLALRSLPWIAEQSIPIFHQRDWRWKHQKISIYNWDTLILPTSFHLSS